MNKFSKIAAVAMFGFAAMGANAATATGTFDVTINLTPTCSVSLPTTAIVVLNYTSFQTAPATGSTSLNIKCTNTLPYVASLSGVSTIAGINFLVAPTAPFPTSGTGANQAIALDVTAAANQSGTCAVAAGCTGTETQTLTVTY